MIVQISPCSLSTLTQPTNGSWGTICPSNSGEIQHGASCDLGCNTGYTPSNQPTCNNGVLSSTTLTCTAAAIEAGANSGNTNPRTCGDTDADGSPNDFDCTSSPNSLNANPAGVTCAGDPCTATECCAVEPVAAPRTCIDFDCTSSPNSLNANPAGVTCAGDPCTATECCAVEPVADVVTEDDFSNVTFTLSGHQESCTKPVATWANNA